jgi:hypothetical protein
LQILLKKPEPGQVLGYRSPDNKNYSLRCPDDYAKAKARALVVETYGADAVNAALGGGGS